MKNVELGSRQSKKGDSEKGSLALEQVLFIGALVTMSVGLFSIYGNIRDYFAGVTLGSAPTNLTQGPGGGGRQ